MAWYNDPTFIGGLIAFAGFALWAATNWHLARGVRNVRTDIETKRAATEAFVEGQIARIERSVADVRGSVAAIHIPPPPPEIQEMREEVGRLREELSDALSQMGRDMGKVMVATDNLQGRLAQLASGTAVEQRQFQAALTKAEGTVEGNVSIQEALQSQNPEAVQYAIMKRIADAKVTDKYAEDHPIGAMIIEAGKIKLLETLQSGFGMPGVSSAGAVRRLPAKSGSDI